MKSAVLIAKCNNRNPAVIRSHLENAIAAFDFDDRIQGSVVIKPNVCVPKRFEEGVITDPLVVRCLIDIIKEKGATPIIAEGAATGHSTWEGFMLNEYQTLGADLVDLNEDEEVLVDVPQGVAMKRVSISRTVWESDAVINVPKMKTHTQTGVTLALKNVKGIVPQGKKYIAHFMGLNHAIVDLNFAIRNKPILHVMDAITALEGEYGPTHGDPVEMDLLIVGEDPVAVDSVCCHLMKIDLSTVKHISHAAERGLGRMSLEDIDLIGEKDIESISHEFAHVKTPSRFEALQRVRFLYEHALLDFPFKEKCKECLLCVEKCPMKALTLDGEKITFNMDKCFGCLICLEICPLDLKTAMRGAFV